MILLESQRTFDNHVQDVLLGLPNGRLYTGPHLQEHLASPNPECEEHLTRWTLGVQSALERGDALSPFSTVVTATPEGTDSALENDLSERGRLEPGGAALSVTECGQNARNRGASLCNHCGRALEDSTGVRQWTLYGHASRAPTESKCTLAVCWTVRNASRVGTQTRSHVPRVDPNGGHETGLPIRRR